MPTSPLSVVLQHLLADLRPAEDGMADGELLARFLRSRDGDALAALVRRHAPMVWGVCRRLLNHHDAEDAFQATFLVLVRKAADVPRQAVANWLYGVARQTAVRLRAAAAKRARRETQVVNMPEPTAAEVREADVQTLVDEELNRLPDHYRGVVVLCDLEGMTRREAARHLGIPEGSVASRLARARVMLAKRLTQRGVVFSGGSVAAALSAGSASASTPSALVASTIKAARLLAAGRAAGMVSAKVAALTEETVKAMFVNKLKAVLAVVLVVGLALGGIGLGIGLPTNPVAMAQAETPKEAPVKKESPTAPVATGKDADKGREGIQVETKDKPLVVHAVLDSVDAQRAVIAAKWVTGNDVNDVFRLLVAKGEALDPRVNYRGYWLGPENLQKVMDCRPKLVNVPVRSDAKIVKEKLQLREGGWPTSLQLTKETVQLNELRAGRVVSLQLAPDRTTGFGIVGIGVVEMEKK